MGTEGGHAMTFKKVPYPRADVRSGSKVRVVRLLPQFLETRLILTPEMVRHRKLFFESELLVRSTVIVSDSDLWWAEPLGTNWEAWVPYTSWELEVVR